ncbi:MAG: GH3 auxin-responsive promoter family protein [Salibacteraceae bacterium]
MAIINSIFGWFIKKRIHQIELFVKYPHDVQHEWFNRLVKTASSTEFGKRYGFSDIQTPEQYKPRVPVRDYEGFKADIDRIIKGEQNILWPSEIRMFAKSSGTTSDKSKFIPVSQESLEECHYKGGKDLLSLYYNEFPDSRLMEGRGLAMGGSSDFVPMNESSYYGDLSAIIIKNLPFWAALHRTPDTSVALNPSWEEKIEQIAQITIQQNITNISGVPSWMLVLLRRILEISGKSHIKEVWPNLEWYVHGGVSFTPYRQAFEEVIGGNGTMRYSETYNASEGFFGIQDSVKATDMLLMLDYGIFFEFMPMDQLGQDNPKTLLLHEVETGVNYALVITTNGGLWRYLIGDSIVFTSTSPYRIKVSGRTKHFINVFGEEVIVDNAERALAQACEFCQARVKEYTVAPVFMDNKKAGAHEWAIEFEKQPEDLEKFCEKLDSALMSVNSDYEAKRKGDRVLRKPMIRAVRPGTFYEWMKQRGKLGGQNKVPRLSNDRKHLEQIIEISNRLNA